MKRIAIIAALPGELKPLVKHWAHERRASVDVWRRKFDEAEWIAACAGAGESAATRAFAEIEKNGPVTLAISAGWAGALREDLVCGRAYCANGVIDAKTGERFETAEAGASHPSRKDKDAAWMGHTSSSPTLNAEDAFRMGHPHPVPHPIVVATTARVAGREEKKRLASAYGAALVDMEAAKIARLAAMRGIPFYCIKAVSDGLNEHLPDFNRFIAADGHFQMARFAIYAALRPAYWPALIRMGENSRRASQSIAESVLNLLDSMIRERNGYPNLQQH
jgi:adenosylhomocysteine nucleosidase